MRIENAPVEHYGAYLKDKTRPPSRGGNTGAWHQHVLTIRGEKYSFLARGARKWGFSRDLVSFEWEWDGTKRYRNIKPETVESWDKDGNRVQRGDRSWKPWRSAEARLPAARSEWRDD